MKLAYIPLFSLFLLASAHAKETEVDVIYNTRNLTPEAALIVAKNAMLACRKEGTHVAVAVLDNGGRLQVLLRDRLAGFSTPDGAILKAKTAINFRSPTEAFSAAINANPKASGIAHLPDVLLLGGGLPIEASGSLVGAIGVAGAPGGEMDEQCAQVGIDAIQEALEFAD